MEEINNYSKSIQLLMDNVKKDILSKVENQVNLTQTKEVINSLFNLLDYQITLINQIFMFNEKNKEDNNNSNCVENLININKDILVSMINKFLNNLNTIYKGKNSGKKKNNFNNKNRDFFKRGKIINLLYSTSNNNNILVSNSFGQKCCSPIKKNIEKEFNSTFTIMSPTPMKKTEHYFGSEKNSYKFLKTKNDSYNMKNKNNKNVYDKLYNDKDLKCDHYERRKNKAFLYHQSYSKSMKDIFVDLNNDYIKNFFTKRDDMSIYHKKNVKDIREKKSK
jgi:hypothetical protein